LNYRRLTVIAMAATIITAIAYPLQQSPEKIKTDTVQKKLEGTPNDLPTTNNSETVLVTSSETVVSDAKTSKSLKGAPPADLTLLKLKSSHHYFQEKRRQKALENGETLPLYESKEEMKQRSQSVVAARVKEVLIKRGRGSEY